MLCKIAELITDVPEDLAKYCADYLYTGSEAPVITIDPARYRRDPYPRGILKESLSYMESAYQFYQGLIDHQGVYLHASAVILDGSAYLFSGPCEVGKSTHARIWCDTFPGAVIMNDDRPALRCIDGVWYAYGTPWCGKEQINRNMCAPVAGVCFLEQADHNAICPMPPAQALQAVMAQTMYKYGQPQQLDTMLNLLDHLLQNVPIYHLKNRPEAAAAILSKEAMEKAV